MMHMYAGDAEYEVRLLASWPCTFPSMSFVPAHLYIASCPGHFHSQETRVRAKTLYFIAVRVSFCGGHHRTLDSSSRLTYTSAAPHQSCSLQRDSWSLRVSISTLVYRRRSSGVPLGRRTRHRGGSTPHLGTWADMYLFSRPSEQGRLKDNLSHFPCLYHFRLQLYRVQGRILETRGRHTYPLRTTHVQDSGGLGRVRHYSTSRIP
ncbi:hypothetical protein OH76DRAFT_179323 [Lentinus brumalis]|uniref:Uncharacterized protein n=1 Tax=Lentinus brumalis TaxID=2498619 RepID=A0A371CNH8_9APHY|nr:hypothetical protein OH76DRAFT_179323 [Polyporus brumalis]